jgi:hypothetical protein
MPVSPMMHPLLADRVSAVAFSQNHRQPIQAAHQFMVLGRVQELGPCDAEQPLLFYRGRYAATQHRPADGPPELVDTLLAWPRHADWM